jgi:hypothetical protein
MIGLSERFASNRCSGWQVGKCVHGFPGTRFCIGSIDPVRVFEAAKPQCCDEEWPFKDDAHLQRAQGER